MDVHVRSDEVSIRAPRILVCDDSPIDRNPLSSILNSEGYQALQAESGDAALHLLKTQEVDLVLLDLNMPSVSGFEVLAYLQEHRRGLPVIVMSGLNPEDIQPHIHRLPVAELPPLLLKPIDVQRLISLIELLLNGDLGKIDHAAGAPENAA